MTEKKKPLISVIVPVYNCEKYLGEAIESILAQTYRLIEILVIDDGSIDNSADVARGFGYPVRYDFQPNRGAGVARNRGVDLAGGSFLAFLDADDLWVKDKLTPQMTTFDENPELDMVFGYVKQFFSPELDEQDKKKIALPHETLPGHHVGTMLIKRDSFLRVGPFGTNWELSEFIDWHGRAMELGLESLMLPEVVMRRRLHKNNQGVYKRKLRNNDYLHALKAALDRRRRQGAQQVKDADQDLQ